MTSPLRRLAPALLLALAPFTVTAQEAVPGGHFIENWDFDGDGTVTLAEAVEKRGEIFYMFDQNENGLLDAPEYDLFDETRAADRAQNADGHKNRRMDVAEGGMTREFTDIDGDGLVSAAEFQDSTSDWFARVDRDADGTITSADFGPGQGRMKGQPKG